MRERSTSLLWCVASATETELPSRLLCDVQLPKRGAFMLPLRACCAYRWTSQVPHHDRACRQALRQQRSGFTVCWAAHLAAAAVNVLQHLLHAGHRGVQLVGLCLDGLRQSLHPGSKPMQLLWGMECRGLALCGSWSPAVPLGPRRFSQPRELSASRCELWVC